MGPGHPLAPTGSFSPNSRVTGLENGFRDEVKLSRIFLQGSLRHDPGHI